MTSIFGKWLKYVGGNDKRLKNVENDLETWEMPKYLGNGIHGAPLKYLRNYVGNILELCGK